MVLLLANNLRSLRVAQHITHHVTQQTKRIPSKAPFKAPLRYLSDAPDPTTTSLLISDDPNNNITPAIVSKVGRNLHLQPNHPLNTIKTIIENHFNATHDDEPFSLHDDLSPIVSTQHCFDDLLIPPDHVSRSPSDTYYISSTQCLRTHTSAHQSTLIGQGLDRFLCTGDVYRRDEIDKSHYPIFHQMEGVKMFPVGTPNEEIEEDLKKVLSSMARTLFGDVSMRWVDAYFPFTSPSYELEIFFNGEWLEVLGSGVIQQQIIRNADRGSQPGWAFGLGLERLAMVLFQIPDIRLFWSSDPRFHSQFQSGEIVKFKEYSKYPPVFRDISFWTGGKEFHPNDLCEIVRGVCVEEDLVEKVELIDEFVHPKTKKVSNCFRVTYRSMDRNLTNEEIDVLHFQVRDNAVAELEIEIR